MERGVFPDVAVKMIEVGESTGAPEMLNSPRLYGRRLKPTSSASSLIEPALLVVMGIVIAAVVLALTCPSQLSSLAGG
jgi:type IV pilus assembly protein PilC